MTQLYFVVLLLCMGSSVDHCENVFSRNNHSHKVETEGPNVAHKVISRSKTHIN